MYTNKTSWMFSQVPSRPGRPSSSQFQRAFGHQPPETIRQQGFNLHGPPKAGHRKDTTKKETNNWHHLLIYTHLSCSVVASFLVINHLLLFFHYVTHLFLLVRANISWWWTIIFNSLFHDRRFKTQGILDVNPCFGFWVDESYHNNFNTVDFVVTLSRINENKFRLLFSDYQVSFMLVLGTLVLLRT